MTERHGELTRYLTFKVDEYAALLAPHLRNVLNEIAKEPEGTTFEELLERVYYRNRLIGPRRLKASLKYLFDRDYIITNYQIAHLKIEHGIDAAKLRHGTVTVIEREPKPKTQTSTTPGGPGRRGPRAPTTIMERGRPHPAKSIYNFLARHGLPAHYDTIAQVFWNELGHDLRDFPLYSPTRRKLVVRVHNHLIRHPELFERLSPGVYWLKGKKQGQTYPELN